MELYLSFPGFRPALIFAVTPAGIFFLALVITFLFRGELGRPLAMRLLIVCAALAVCLFNISLPIFNIAIDGHLWEIENAKDEFINGGVSLRVASVIIGWQYIRTFYVNALVRFWNTPDVPEPDENSSIDDWARDPGLVDGSAAQSAIYSSAVVFLWLYRIESIELIPLAIMSWALLFIADDWGIVDYYIHSDRIYVRRWHKLKFVSFNALLLVMAVTTQFMHFNLLALIPIVIMVFHQKLLSAWFGLYDRVTLEFQALKMGYLDEKSSDS